MKAFTQSARAQYCVHCDGELTRVDYGKWGCPRCFGTGLVNGHLAASALAILPTHQGGLPEIIPGVSADGPPEPVPSFARIAPKVEREIRNLEVAGSSLRDAAHHHQAPGLRFDFDFLSYKNRWRKHKPWAPPRLPSPPSLRVAMAEFMP